MQELKGRLSHPGTPTVAQINKPDLGKEFRAGGPRALKSR
jgi:hypothetical protein